MGADEGRRSPRVTPANSIAGRTQFATNVQVVDLSASGALVVSERLVPVGSPLDLELVVGGHEPLVLHARVSRSVRSSDGGFRLGLQFDALDAERKERLNHFLTRGEHSERRAAPRIHIGYSAQLYKEVVLEVVNLGLFGGLFRLDAPLEFESQHDFVFTLPQGEVHARGLVRHCEAWAGPGPDASPRFWLGVEFTKLEGADRERVLRYLEEQNPTG